MCTTARWNDAKHLRLYLSGDGGGAGLIDTSQRLWCFLPKSVQDGGKVFLLGLAWQHRSRLTVAHHVHHGSMVHMWDVNGAML